MAALSMASGVMMNRAVLLLVLLGLVVSVVVVPRGAHAVKTEEFKLCSHAGFCNRNRLRGWEKKPGGGGGAGSANDAAASAKADAKDAAADAAAGSDMHDVVFTASYLNEPNEKTATFMLMQEYTEGTSTRRSRAAFQMSVCGYSGGLVRVMIDELNGTGGRGTTTGRFHVPEVVLEDKLSALQVKWFAERNDAERTVLRLADTAVRFQVVHRTMKMTVLQDSDAVIELNTDGLLRYEPARASTFARSETFRSHVDTQPRGEQAIAVEMVFPLGDEVYGIPERATTFALKPTVDSTTSTVLSEPYRLYNLDVFEYLHESPMGLYGSVPMMVSHGKRGKTAGVFWLNASEMFIDVDAKRSATGGRRIDWIAESGVMDLFLFTGPSVEKVYAQLAAAVGTTPVPPKFALGYHQCRWNYRNTEDVYAVHAGFEEHDMPYDVLWLDIEHTDGKRYMTWDKNAFDDPIGMQTKLASEGRKMVTIVDPHVKRDPAYGVYQKALDKGYFIRNVKKEVFDGWCWPGSSSYLDVLSPEVRQWWAEQLSLENYPGSTEHLFIWNDMNEPSVFNGPEITMQKDNLHFGDVEHRDVHNMYGFLYHKATSEGLLQRSGNTKRPFVLSRAFFMGTQRVGAIWTGDNTADWNHLKVSIPMLLSLNAAGLPFVGADVGGFFGNPSAELVTRWYQLGSFYPFYRGHAHLETKRREPWLFGEPYTSLIRSAFRRRYQLLAYLYTLFAESSRSGMPVMRSMWMEFPTEAKFIASSASDEQFMLGSSILVAPVLEEGATSVRVSLPSAAAKETFYHMFSGERVVGEETRVPVTMESVPVFARGGHIIPSQLRLRRSSETMANDPYTLIVYPDAAGNASGSLYVDDGESTDYERGEYALLHFTFARGNLSVRVEPGSRPLHSSVSIERIVLMGAATRKPGKVAARTMVDGSVHELHTDFGPCAFFPDATNAISVKTIGALVVDTSDTSTPQFVVDVQIER